jgi:hypothetical protein
MTTPDPYPYGPPPQQPRPGTSLGRALWIAWCILWALFWITVGWLFLPLLNVVLAVLSLFAIVIGRPKQVLVYPAAPIPIYPVPPPPDPQHFAWHQQQGLPWPSPLCTACIPPSRTIEGRWT